MFVEWPINWCGGRFPLSFFLLLLALDLALSSNCSFFSPPEKWARDVK